MEKRDWSRSHIENLITLYEEFPSLWDVCSTQYRDRVRKAEDWKYIALKLEREVDEIQRKMHNLRNQFSQELKKCRDNKSGQGTSQSYQSKWLYFESLKFIKGGIVARKSTGNLITEDTTPADIEDTDGSNIPNESTAIKPIQPLVPPRIDNENVCKRKKTMPPEDDDILKSACKIMSQKDDEYDVFGSFVASELRALKKESNMKRLKRMIQRAIIEVAEDDDEYSE